MAQAKALTIPEVMDLIEAKLAAMNPNDFDNDTGWQEQKSAQTRKAILTAAVKCLTDCLLYTSPSPRDRTRSRMPSSA